MTRTALICLALALAGCATAPPRTDATATAQNAPAAAKPACVTASRLPQSNCLSGSSYSQQELNSTGQQNNNLATSLKMLDPSVH